MFVDFRDFGDDIIALINPNDALVLVAGFKAVVSAWFIGYLLYVGYMTMAGRTRTPLSDIMIKVVVFTAISAFAFNIGGYFTYVQNGINGLNTWASSLNGGGGNIFTKLDDGLIMIGELHQKLKSASGFFSTDFIIGIAMFLVYIAYYLFAGYVTIILMFNAFVLKVIIFMFPITVLSLYFSWFKGVFERWIELALSNLLMMMFVTLFFNAIWGKFSTLMTKYVSTATDLPPFETAFSLAGLSLIAGSLIWLSTKLSESLTRSSINALPGGAAGRGAAAGYFAAKGAKATYSAGKSGASFARTEGGKAMSNVATVSSAIGSSASSLAKSSQKKSSVSGGGGGTTSGNSSSKGSRTSSEWAKRGAINKYKKAKEGD